MVATTGEEFKGATVNMEQQLIIIEADDASNDLNDEIVILASSLDGRVENSDARFRVDIRGEERQVISSGEKKSLLDKFEDVSPMSADGEKVEHSNL